MIKLPELEMSEMIDIRNSWKVQNRISGVYFLYGKNKELLYIGKAKLIEHRAQQHKRDERVGHNYYYMSYVEIDCPVDRDIYETYYINKYQPPINRSKTFLYESSYEDYKKVYDWEVEAEKQFEIEYREALRNFRMGGCI